MQPIRPGDEPHRVAVRCRTCGKLLFYKVSPTSGVVEWKCSRCGDIRIIDLALRRAKKQNPRKSIEQRGIFFGI